MGLYGNCAWQPIPQHHALTHFTLKTYSHICFSTCLPLPLPSYGSNNAYSICVYEPGASADVLRKVAPLFQFALCLTPYSLISFHSLIASFRPLEITFNYSCLFSTNTLEMELANKQCQATLILVYSRDPLMHWRSGRLLTGTCYCLQLLCNSSVDTVNMFTGAPEPWPNTTVQR